MEAHPIVEDFGRRSRFARSAIDLVDCVGRAEFSATLFRLAHEATGCQHLTAFALDGHRSPSIVLAENVGSSRVAFLLAQKYAAHYWRLDPANRVFANVGATAGYWGVESSASDITDAVYRGHCYNAVGLDHRLSISHRSQGRIYRLNFYSGYGRRFSEAASSSILETADLLMALVRRHGAEAENGPGMGADTFAQRLRRLAPTLSARELEVTALIASGLSSHGISLELGISINTVLTYRKRAYARLNISTQNELMHLLLGTRS